MSARIKILPGHETLVRGKPMNVNILVSFDRKTRVRGIHAKFYGAERTEATYTVTTTDHKGNARTETRTAVQYVEIVSQSHLLHGQPRKGFFSRLGDSLMTWFGGGKHEVLGPGDHEFNVAVQVPQDAKASFKGKKCSVSYRLDVSVDLPIKMDWRAEQTFDVPSQDVRPENVNPVHAQFPDEDGRSFWDKTFGKDVTLNLALDRDVLSVREKALAMLTVDSEEPLKVNQIEVNLIGEERTQAQGHTDGYSHKHSMGEVESPNIISAGLVHEFEVVVPEIDGPFSQTGTNFEVSWWVEARLRVPWAKDPIIRVPVTLLSTSPSAVKKPLV